MAETVEKAAEHELGRTIVDARLEAGIPTSAEAARRVGMAQTNYWRLEHRSEMPSWMLVHRVIVGLGLPLEKFFPDSLILAAADRISGKSAPGK
jgi:transcriptional regulator with XRE-family HTH domain